MKKNFICALFTFTFETAKWITLYKKNERRDLWVLPKATDRLDNKSKKVTMAESHGEIYQRENG